MTIGKKIYELRNKLGLTQKQFAEIVGVSQSAINYWENEKRHPRIEQLQLIAKALDMPIFEFLDDEYFDIATDEEPGSEENEVKFFDEKREAIKDILNSKEISDKEKNAILNDFILQTEIVANMHLEDAKLGAIHLFEMCYDSLNAEGQEKAEELLIMLTKIPEYQKGYEPPED